MIPGVGGSFDLPPPQTGGLTPEAALLLADAQDFEVGAVEATRNDVAEALVGSDIALETKPIVDKMASRMLR